MSNFYLDVLSKRPEFHSTSRQSNLELLEPTTRQRVKDLLTDAESAGFPLLVYETFRSSERQLELFNKGVTKLKTVGVHLYGLACDIVKSNHGQPSWDGDFHMLGVLAKKHGLIWGGDWGNPKIKHSFVDLVHVQRCTIDSQSGLFAGTWYPDNQYNPTAVLIA